MVDVMMGHAQWKAGEVPDHHGCRLGKWYDAVQLPQIKALPMFARLVGPHQRVHAAAKTALTAHAVGDYAAALAALTDMNEASHDVLALLDELSTALFDRLAHADRRRCVRTALSQNITAKIDGVARPVTLHDVSPAGIGMEGLGTIDIGKKVVFDHQGDRFAGTAVWSDGKSGGVLFEKEVPKTSVAALVG